jgi:starch phosphorylase
LRTDNCEELVRFVRLRTERQRASFGASSEEIEEARVVFDPGALTLGFARRFAIYKRPNLLLHDPERLANKSMLFSSYSPARRIRPIKRARI